MATIQERRKKIQCSEKNREKMKKNSLKKIFILQLTVIIYTFSGVMAKLASASDSWKTMLLFLGMDFFFLAVYALCWQQMLKRFSLSVAYANRAVALLWSALWARVLFGDFVSIKQIIGIIVVILGIVIINAEKGEAGND